MKYIIIALTSIVSLACNSRTEVNNSVVQSIAKKERFQKVGEYTGTLVLPQFNPAEKGENDNCSGGFIENNSGERRSDGGVWIELSNSPQKELQGLHKKIWLRYNPESKIGRWAKAATFNIKFTDATRQSIKKGNVHAPLLNCLASASPLETLAAARPFEATQVLIKGTPRLISERDGTIDFPPSAEYILQINDEPVQISGPMVTLIQFASSPKSHINSLATALTEDYNLAIVRHYDENTRSFSTSPEAMQFAMEENNSLKAPHFILAGIEKDPLNQDGWYAYGKNVGNTFLVSALQPRSLLRVNANSSNGMIIGKHNSRVFVDKQNFLRTKERKGTTSSTLVHPFDSTVHADIPAAADDLLQDFPYQVSSIFSEGRRFLAVYLFGGVYGKGGDSPAPFNIVTGHYSYGEAKVIRAPFTGELMFDIEYHQVYSHNSEGIIAGAMKWHEFQGNVRRGWVWTRPTSETLVALPWLTKEFEVSGVKFNALDGSLAEEGRPGIIGELDKMGARFRAGDGTQVSPVTPFTSCVQDSSKALFVAIRRLQDAVEKNPQVKKEFESGENSDDHSLKSLFQFANKVEKTFTFFGSARKDWEENTDRLIPIASIFSSLHPELNWVDHIVPQGAYHENFFDQFKSLGAMIPRDVHDKFLNESLDAGATLWTIRANQIGGVNENTWPMAPTSLFIHNR